MIQERKQELINLLRTIQSCTQTVPNYGDKESVIDCWELAFEWLDEQQPIPRDINKWQEAKCWERFPEGESGNEMRRFGWNECAQLLLPELQQLRKENESLIKQQKLIVDANAKLDKQIEQQKSQIDELKNTLNHELEVHKEFIQQAAEIESLKNENAELKRVLQKYLEI